MAETKKSTKASAKTNSSSRAKVARAKTTTGKRVAAKTPAPAKGAFARKAAVVSKTNQPKTSASNTTSNAAKKANAAAKAPQAKMVLGAKKKKKEGKKVSLHATIIVGAVCVVLGLLLGFYPLGAGFVMGGRTTLPEHDLDRPVAMYIYKGIPNFVSARQALDEGSGLSSAQQSDGSYKFPSADEILASVRTAVLNSEVTARGITVSDEEMKDYAQQQLGSSDFSKIATQYGLDEPSVQNYVRQAAGVKKLQEEVTGTDTDATAPLAPEEGKNAATYKDYILNLLGSDWDSETNSWANTDNDYYEALKGTAFVPDQATYEQASAVYSVASKQYQTKSATAAQTWNDFINEILMNCQVRIGEAIL